MTVFRSNLIFFVLFFHVGDQFPCLSILLEAALDLAFEGLGFSVSYIVFFEVLRECEPLHADLALVLFDRLVENQVSLEAVGGNELLHAIKALVFLV